MLPWLVVGLGNPGPTYASHRHNVGFLIVEELAARTGARFSVPKGIRAEVAESRLGVPGTASPRLGLMKSRSYMNDTGGPVAGLLRYYKIEPDRMVVVHDELDIDPGQLRVKFGGGGKSPQRVKANPRAPGPRGLLPGRPGGRPPAAR